MKTKTPLKLTLHLDADTRSWFLAEARAEGRSPDSHLEAILTTRFAHPSWPERAEASALAMELACVTHERDRARSSAVLHEAEAEQAIRCLAEVAAALEASPTDVDGALALAAVRLAARTEAEL